MDGKHLEEVKPDKLLINKRRSSLDKIITVDDNLDLITEEFVEENISITDDQSKPDHLNLEIKSHTEEDDFSTRLKLLSPKSLETGSL